MLTQWTLNCDKVDERKAMEDHVKEKKKREKKSEEKAKSEPPQAEENKVYDEMPPVDPLALPVSDMSENEEEFEENVLMASPPLVPVPKPNVVCVDGEEPIIPKPLDNYSGCPVTVVLHNGKVGAEMNRHPSKHHPCLRVGFSRAFVYACFVRSFSAAESLFAQAGVPSASVSLILAPGHGTTVAARHPRCGRVHV
jgi:hypothetical protein